MNLHTQTLVLHIANTQELYAGTMFLLRHQRNRYDFAVELREFIEEVLMSATNGLFAKDVIMSSLAEVNWATIADDYWNEYHNIEPEEAA